MVCALLYSGITTEIIYFLIRLVFLKENVSISLFVI
ncbi:hypothetical protein M121_4601, partial [Bacteroides fragilis str. 3783N2-1]